MSKIRVAITLAASLALPSVSFADWNGGGGGGSGGVTSLQAACGLINLGSAATGAVTSASNVPVVPLSTSTTIATTACNSIFQITAASVTTTLPSAATVGAGWSTNGLVNTSGSTTILTGTGTVNGASVFPITIANGAGYPGLTTDGTNWFTIPTPATTLGSITGFGANWATILAAAAGTNWSTVLNANLDSTWVTALGAPLGTGWTAALAATYAPTLPIVVGFPSGNYMPGNRAAVAASGSLITRTANTLYCQPINISYPGFTAKALGILVQTLDASGHWAGAIYANNFTTGKPAGLLASVSPQAIASATGFTVAITANSGGASSTAALPAGPAWSCDTVDTAIAKLYSDNVSPDVAYMIGAASLADVISGTNLISGWTCTLGAGCGGSSVAWSAGTVTLPSTLSSATLTKSTAPLSMTYVPIQVN